MEMEKVFLSQPLLPLTAFGVGYDFCTKGGMDEFLGMTHARKGTKFLLAVCVCLLREDCGRSKSGAQQKPPRLPMFRMNDTSLSTGKRRISGL